MEVLVFLTLNHYDFDIVSFFFIIHFERGCIVDVVTERREKKFIFFFISCFYHGRIIIIIFPLYLKSLCNVFNWIANGAASSESIWAFIRATIGRHLQLATVIPVGWRCSDKKHVGIAAVPGWDIGQLLSWPIRIIWICGKLWVKWPQPWESLEHLRDSFAW